MFSKQDHTANAARISLVNSGGHPASPQPPRQPPHQPQVQVPMPQYPAYTNQPYPYPPQQSYPQGYNQMPPYQNQSPQAYHQPYPQGYNQMPAIADQLTNLGQQRNNFEQQVTGSQRGAAGSPGIGNVLPEAGPRPGSNPLTTKDEWDLDYSEIVVNKEIARGSFGVVYQGSFRGTDVAVKKLIVQNLDRKQMQDFADEVSMLKKLHHPNVVLLIGVCSQQPNLALITELLAGSLWNLLHDQNQRMDFKLQHSLITDTARGMNYLHLFKPPVVHRDLKSPNLLVDKNFNVKIADFGLARVKAQMMTGNLGTCQYMAPEVIQSATYTEKADVYSFGIVIWEVLSRQAPYQGMQPMQIAYTVIHQRNRPPIAPHWPKELVSIMTDCWAPDPASRPPFSVILDRLRAIRT
jgi:tRNA A-37 threonylcarbamoyl transferase component Bud32